MPAKIPIAAGCVFGKLTVTGPSNRGRHYSCRCTCGVVKDVRGDHLRSGRVISCGGPGCRFSYTDISGNRYGRWQVLRRDFAVAAVDGPYWFCQCDCGTARSVKAVSMTSGRSVSCGCYMRESRITHGGTHTDEYRIWRGMQNRCFNANDHGFENYGGRGITVCDRWLGEEGFINFLADMGHRPSDSHSVDRKNNDGNYEPTNCRWATNLEQGANKRDSRLTIYQGEVVCGAELARRLNTHHRVIYDRLNKGLTGDEIAATLSPRKTVVFNGCTMSRRAFAKMLGIAPHTVNIRLSLGRTTEDIAAEAAVRRARRGG